ncbi:MAG: alpha-amylase family glycosyl hydrolase [Kiritimatiellae bacterium]|nr:alpha-amylase family glycosyl hydrolase [Kiritimatiellia bacterium]
MVCLAREMIILAVALCACGAHALTDPVAAADALKHRNHAKSKAFADRFFPTYPSVCNVKTAQARAVPSFLRGAVIYQLFTRIFTPEGTFRAAERKLSELKDLGVDVIYLTPHQLADDDADVKHWSARQRKCKLGNAKNPYRQKDFFAVDPEYGTAADLKDFVKTAHTLGMRVMFDLVYFHCGPKAVFLAEHPDFIVRNPDGSPRLGDWAFPEMDISKREVRDYLHGNMVHFLREYDVDGFRCDVADMLPVDFWEEGYAKCKAVKPDIFMMCEGLKGDDQIGAFDLSYGFYTQWTMVELLKGKVPASMLETAWRAQRRDYPQGFHWMRCFENHDFANVLPGEKRKEALYGHALNAAMLATCFLLDGVPMLYNGQEIADAAPHSIFANREHGGWHIDWTKSDEAYAQERRALVKRLTAIRHAHPLLFDAPVEWLDTGAGEKTFAFRRQTEDSTFTLAVNVTKEAVAIQLDGAIRTLPPQAFLLEEKSCNVGGQCR